MRCQEGKRCVFVRGVTFVSRDDDANNRESERTNEKKEQTESRRGLETERERD